jgi:hypothetical protein
MGSALAELRQNKPAPANCGPMMQQSTKHGYEMYAQEFVRLIGCHESNRQKEDVAQRARPRLNHDRLPP